MDRFGEEEYSSPETELDSITIVFPIILVVLLLSVYKPSVEQLEAIPAPIGTGSNWGRLSNTTSKWYFFPKNNFTETIAKQLEETSKLMRTKEYFSVDYKTPEDLMKFYSGHKTDVVIIFDNSTENGVSYTMVIPYDRMQLENNQIFGDIANCRETPFELVMQISGVSCPEMSYYVNGFAFVQTAIDSTIIRVLSKEKNDFVIPWAELFIYPKPMVKVSITMAAISCSVAICFILSQLLPIWTINLVKEKEKRIKEAMFMMGLRPTVYWSVWFAIEGTIVFFLSIVMTIVFSLMDFIKNSNFLITFLLVLMVGLTIIEMSAILSMVFDKEMTTTQLVPFISLLIIIPILLITFHLPTILWFILSLHSPIALALGIRSIFEITIVKELSLSPYNMFFGSEFPVGFALVVLAFDILLYALLAIYLDKVMPGKYGVREKHCFCLNPKFWSKEKSSQTHPNGEQNGIKADVEEVSKDLKDKGVIVIDNISKKFSDTNTLAVNSISMTIYESQITALLGHNGAGKTTLINMLLGAIPPTSGTAHIYGKSVRNPSEMSKVRSMFGVCLQENILFDELDSREHLIFFGEMKGLKGNKLRDEVKQLLIDVDLYQNQTTPSKNLSGGQMRKLCIAIALIGNPKVVILDEPTSGVDIAIRQQIWKMIGSYKTDKTIIMTTHFMEEADVMADRKAIISKGRLRCVGSSLFLKKRFGVGYHLTIDLSKSNDDNNQSETDIKDITSLVTKEIPNSKFKAFIGSEVFYVLPQNQSQNFAQLFSKLEERIKSKKDVKSFGISMTTLEEVFLKLEDEAVANEELRNGNHSKSVESSADILREASKSPNFCQSFLAYLRIKYLLQRRNPWGILSMIFGALIFGFVLFSLNITTKEDKSKPFLLSPDIYGKTPPVLKYQSKSGGLTEFTSNMEQLGVKTEQIDGLNVQNLNNSYMSVVFNRLEREATEWQWLFNETYIFSLPILQNLMANMYLRQRSGQNSRIKTSLHLLPKTQELKNAMNSVIDFLIIYYLWITILLFSFSLSIETIDDRETKIIETIRISGMGFWCYWTTNLVMHSFILIFQMTLWLAVIGIAVKFFVFKTITVFLCFYIVLMESILSFLLLEYVLGHIFVTKASASILVLPLMLISFLFLGITVLVFFLGIRIITYLVYLFGTIFWPPFGSIATIVVIYMYSMDIPVVTGVTIVEVIGGILGMFLSICFYLFLLKVVDSIRSGDNLFEALGLSGTKMDFYLYESTMEDEDVIRERSDVLNVMNTKQNFPILLVYGLRKVFYSGFFSGIFGGWREPEVAINNLSFMVKESNIFGLLGPNGAGKTTTMKIIIRQERATNGTVLINGREVNSAYLHKQIGYCPQHDTLFKKITLKEHLKLFAAIRGVNPKDIGKLCDKFMKILRIKEHENKYSEQLSGGTKRKLCYILSLMGPSDLVLLDEPSTGMDPHSKRFLWTTIQNTFSIKSSKSAVLTTHSMEEANALCTRIAIMTKGVMRCIGSVQHLKNKYGAGYVLTIKWEPNLTKSDSVKQIVSNIFIKWNLREESEDRLTADVPQESVRSLSTIFLSLENMKSNQSNGIQDYSFSQTTLEQVFIHFARDRLILNP